MIELAALASKRSLNVALIGALSAWLDIPEEALARRHPRQPEREPARGQPGRIPGRAARAAHK